MKIFKTIKNLIQHPKGTINYFSCNLFNIIIFRDRHESETNQAEALNISIKAGNKLTAIMPKNDDILEICWMINNTCNYRCPYCRKDLWGGKMEYKNLDFYLDRFENIFQQAAKIGFKNCYFFLTGGEPTLWESLPEFSKQIVKLQKKYFLQFRYGINTNLHKPLKWWKKNYHYFGDISASFHVTQTDHDEFLKKYMFLSRKTNILARLMMNDKFFQEVIDFGEKLKKKCKFHSFEYVPLMQELTPGSSPVLYDELWKEEFIKNNSKGERTTLPLGAIKKAKASKNVFWFSHFEDGTITYLDSNQIIAHNLNRFKGWKCYIGSCLNIDHNGEIRNATCLGSKIVGDFSNNSFNLMETPIICPNESCFCGTDIKIKKKKI